MSKKPIVKSVAVHYKQPKRETLTLEKKASNDVPVSRLQLGAQGIDGLKSMSGVIAEHCHSELRWPQCLKTYSQMSLDPTIAAVLNFYNMMIARAKFQFVAPVGASAQSLAATEFLNYCMNNMEDQTWQQFLSGVGTYRIFGFSIAEKLWTTVHSGKYAGKLKWKRLAPRAQETVDHWLWDKNDPERLVGVVQKVMNMDTSRYKDAIGGVEKKIDRNKFMLFRFDPRKDNPQGTSPLDGCWVAWKYLTAIREYQAIGIAKDMSGVVEIGIPVEKLIEAAADPTGPAAALVASVRLQAAALHAGDRAFIEKPIDYDDQGNPLYTLKLLGIEGGGKQNDLPSVITQYQNEILTCYSASMLKMGQNASGSFALSDNMNSMLAYGVEHNLQIILDQINNDLVPQTLALNGWLFDDEQMPRLDYKDITPASIEEVSKGIQRMITANAMSTSKELDKHLHRLLGIPEPTYDESEKIPEEFLSVKKSAAGKGDGTSGVGSTQAAVGGDNNSENTA